MANHEPIYLRAQPPEEPEKRSIPFLLSRLVEQKGGFRNITEESLTAGTTDASSDDASRDDDEPTEEKSRGEQLQAARGEIVQFSMFVPSASASPGPVHLPTAGLGMRTMKAPMLLI